MSTQKADILVEFKCPFCGSHCQAGYLIPQKTPVVFHENPLCETYMLDEGPADFLQRVRAEYMKQGVTDWKKKT